MILTFCRCSLIISFYLYVLVGLIMPPSPLHPVEVKCVGVSQKGKALSFGLKIVGSSPAPLAKEIKLKVDR